MATDPSALADMIYTEMRNEYWPATALPPEAEAETKRYYRTIARALTQYFDAFGGSLSSSFSDGMKETLEEALAEHIQEYH